MKRMGAVGLAVIMVLVLGMGTAFAARIKGGSLFPAPGDNLFYFRFGSCRRLALAR